MLSNFFQERLALSKDGADNFIKGVFFTTIFNITLMFPAILTFLFLEDYLPVVLESYSLPQHGLLYYSIIGIIFILVVYFMAKLQYKSVYVKVYDESAIRRISLAEKLRKLPLAFFGEKDLSDLTSTIMEDSTSLEQTFSHAVPQLFASIISTILIAIGLFFYNWQLSLATFWVLPIALFTVIMSKKFMTKSHIEAYTIKRKVTDHIQEGLDNFQEIKAYTQEKDYLDKLDKKLNTYEKSLIKGELIGGVALNISYILLKLGLATVIIVGAKLLANGTVDVFVYLIFIMIASRIYDPITEVFNYIAILVFLDVRINRIKEINSMPSQEGKKELDINNYDIVFKNVDFSYEDNKQVLQNVSFTAKQGETTALIGPSGGGKSTTAKLAARFWDIQSGTITLGGEDISKIDPETLLEKYSVVFQDVVLFNSSIYDNIKIGKKDASKEEIMKAAKLANCEEFINLLPDNYDTIIGENGATLSGGERQRISIARALLKDSPIVLLDEATASLDVENESKIQEGLSELIKDKTVIIIAHRMRTIKNANKIIVLKEGKVVENGSPQELKEKDSIFSKMTKMQSN